MGRIYWLFFSFLQAGVMFSAKSVPNITSTEAAYIRAIACTVFAVYQLKKQNVSIYFKDNKIAHDTCMYIFTIGSVAYLCFFIALEYLPMSLVSVLISTVIFWLPIIGYFILGTKIGIGQSICCIGSFIAIIIINDPWKDFKKDQIEDTRIKYFNN